MCWRLGRSCWALLDRNWPFQWLLSSIEVGILLLKRWGIRSPFTFWTGFVSTEIRLSRKSCRVEGRWQKSTVSRWQNLFDDKGWTRRDQISQLLLDPISEIIVVSAAVYKGASFSFTTLWIQMQCTIGFTWRYYFVCLRTICMDFRWYRYRTSMIINSWKAAWCTLHSVINLSAFRSHPIGWLLVLMRDLDRPSKSACCTDNELGLQKVDLKLFCQFVVFLSTVIHVGSTGICFLLHYKSKHGLTSWFMICRN